MKKNFPNVLIVGLGLIGGSIALELKRKKLAQKVIGISRSFENRREALRLKAVDEAHSEVGSFVNQADLVIIATPVGQIVSLVKKINPYLKKGALITDVGSTKTQIVQALGGQPGFIGGHPIAGTEHSGMKAAVLNLFQGKKWILTPSSKTPISLLNSLKKWVKQLGAVPVILTPQAHDSLYAALSHLPNVVSYALANSLLSFKQFPVSKWGGSSVRDMTRLAESPPEMWRDICLSNAPALLKILRVFQKELQVFEKNLRSEDPKKNLDWFARARKFREKL